MIPLSYTDYLRRYAPMFDPVVDRIAETGVPEDAWAVLSQDFPSACNMFTVAALSRRVNSSAYALSTELQEEFAEAELPTGLNAFDLDLPSPCFWLALPDCALELFGGKDTGWLQIHGAYVFSGDALARVNASWETTEGGIGLAIWACPKSLSKDAYDDAFYTLGFRFSDMEDIESTIVEKFGTPGRSDLNPRTGMTLQEEKTAEDRRREAAHIGILVRYVFNLLLHLNIPRPTYTKTLVDFSEERAQLLDAAKRRKPNKAKKLIARAERLSTYSYIVLEPTEEDREHLQNRRNDIAAGRKGHWRQAHYRRVWVGSRTSAAGHPQKGDRMELRKIGRSWVSGTPSPENRHTKIVIRQKP